MRTLIVPDENNEARFEFDTDEPRKYLDLYMQYAHTINKYGFFGWPPQTWILKVINVVKIDNWQVTAIFEYKRDGWNPKIINTNTAKIKQFEIYRVLDWRPVMFPLDTYICPGGFTPPISTHNEFCSDSMTLSIIALMESPVFWKR